MKSMQVIAVCLVAIVSYAVAKPQVPLDTPEVAAAKAAHFAAHYAARTGYIHPYISPVIPAVNPYIAATHPYIAAARVAADQSGAYVHDPTGDVAAPYLHDPSGDYASAYAYALPYAAPVIVNGVPVDTPEVAAAKAAHLAAHAVLG